MTSLSYRLRFASVSPLVVAMALAATGAFVGCGSGDSDGGGGNGTSSTLDAGTDAREAGASDAAKDQQVVPDVGGDTETDTGEPDAPGTDSDHDGVPDDKDKCPGFDDKKDSDEDGTPDGCEKCPGEDESIDNNGNGVADCAERVRLWLRADYGVMTSAGDGGTPVPAKDGEPVVLWKDRSAGQRNAEQTSANRQPVWVESVDPVGPVVRFRGEGDVGDPAAAAKDDSLQGPPLVNASDARTIFLVARQTPGMSPDASSLLELNRAPSGGSGSRFRITPELGVRVLKGHALFSHQHLGSTFHVITVDVPSNSSTTSVRLWYDGIPLNPSETQARAIATGRGGYRIGDAAPVGQYGFSGDIAEVLVYDQQLPATVRNSVGYDLEKRHGLSTCYIPPKNTDGIPLYIIAGDENAAGFGDADALTPTLAAEHSDMMVWTSTVSSTSWFHPLAPGFGHDSKSFGPELALGPALVGTSDQSVILFKYTAAKTTISPWIDRTNDVSKRFETQLSRARSKLTSAGVLFDFAGFVWIHGEQDAKSESGGSDYAKDLSTLVQNVRTFLAKPSLPVVVVGLPPGLPTGDYPSASAVHDAQKSAVQKGTNMEFVDTTGVSLDSGTSHFDAVGQLKLGVKIAESLKKLAK